MRLEIPPSNSYEKSAIMKLLNLCNSPLSRGVLAFHCSSATVSNEACLVIKATSVGNTTQVRVNVTQMHQVIVPKTSSLCSENMS